MQREVFETECDNPGCGKIHSVPHFVWKDEIQAGTYMPEGWIKVTRGGVVSHYCSEECLRPKTT